MNGLWSFTVPENEAKDICEIIGSEGSMRFSIFKMQNLLITKNGQDEEMFFDPVPHVQQPMIEKVADYFSDRGPNPCSGAEGVIVMQMLDAFTKK
jgi:predicted dehydrogenase